MNLINLLAEPGESLVSVYNHFAYLMIDRTKQHEVSQLFSVNTKFLNSLQPEWLKYVTQVRLAKQLTVDSFDDLFDYLSQFEKLVNASRAKKLEKSHDPLALVAHTGSSSRNTSSYYVTHPSFVVDYDEDTIDDDQINSNNQFDFVKGNVNSGSVEKDTHVYDPCALETLARNAYDEAVIQQRFAQTVQQQNMTLTSQIEMAKRVQKKAESQLYRDRDIIRDLEKQQDKLSQKVKHFNQKNEELQQSHLILKRKMSENEDKYHDTILDLEEKLKKNVDLFLKIGNSLQAMFMLCPKPLSVYDQQLKHGFGYPNPYTLRQAILECPKLYVASRTGNIEIPLNVRDSEETLEDAFKSQQKMNKKMNDPIVVANKQNCWTIDYKQLNALYNDFVPQKESFVEQTCSSSSYIPFVKILETKTMPSELPLINGLFNINVGIEKLFLLIKQNSKRASMFYTSKEEIALNDFCRDQVKPLLNELLDYFDGFQNLFQRDIKEMKDAFEQNDVYLDEIERQNDLLKDQLLEASLKHDIELCVLLNHECVDKFLHDELEQVKKKSLEIQEGLKARIKILEKDKLEDENVSLDFKVQSLIKERDNAKMEYKKLFDSIKKTRSQTQKEMDELIAHVSEKTYAYGAIRAENQNLLVTISELKARMKNGENGECKLMIAVAKRFKAKLCFVFLYAKCANSLSMINVVQIVLWVVDSGCSKHMTGDRSLLRNFVEKFMGTVSFRNDNFAAITGYGDYIHGNITIFHVYYVEGDDLLTGGRDSNLYTISISDMAASSPICLMSKATSTKSWLWHRRLSHLNFGTINDLTKLDLVDGLPKFKYGKDHLCSACERGKSKKASHPPKLIPNETPEIIKKFIAQAQLNYKAKVCKIRTDNGTEFKNATLKAYYEKLGIMQQFSIAHTPQQNGVVERRNHTLVEAARTMLIFSRLPEFIWAEADLDNLFGPMFEDYFEHKTSDTTINSAAQPTHDQEDLPSTSSIIIDTHKVPPVVTTSDKQTSPISLQESDEVNQEDSADFDGNTQFVPYDSLNHEEIKSSTTNLEPSNVQNFHQVQPSTHIWTKDHPLDQVIGDPSKPVMTRQRLHTDSEVCMYALTVSTFEPKNIKEVMADHSWIESMQDELNQFERLQVWESVTS
ncbi:integrase, catalytic region, zinc finger, CCHC-type containing protein [Tanacetum coccineum]